MRFREWVASEKNGEGPLHEAILRYWTTEPSTLTAQARRDAAVDLIQKLSLSDRDFPTIDDAVKYASKSLHRSVHERRKDAANRERLFQKKARDGSIGIGARGDPERDPAPTPPEALVQVAVEVDCETAFTLLRAAISELNPNYREALELVLSGVEYEVAAKVMGVSIGQFGSLVNRGRARLQARLGREKIFDDIFRNAEKRLRLVERRKARKPSD